MGSLMAGNLVAKGFEVRGWDVRAGAVEAFGARGGIGAADIPAACGAADALVLMVVDAAQAEDVLFYRGGLSALPAGAIVILMATCPPAAVAELGQRVVAAGRRFVDAPVSGGTAGARAGSLTVMAAASEVDFAAVAPILQAVGQRIFHVGDSPGQGATVKTINQLLCVVHLAAAAEALSLASRAGVDLACVLEIVGGSAASSWMLKDRGPRMLEAGPAVTSAVDIFVKDLGIVLQAARDGKLALPLAAAAHRMFLTASGSGYGGQDDSQVIRAYDAPEMT
jgi:3-hydroxyisobutyrate dehydrogenase